MRFIAKPPRMCYYALGSYDTRVEGAIRCTSLGLFCEEVLR